eukprot:GHVT01021531.1.p2 GENE.GHVT01021531.1~~GHVT01021531.1.p2  ORF type:complete len:116 (+),score=8.15 GHVT01021531.1:446-793(+)
MKRRSSRCAPVRSVLANVDFDSLGEALGFLDSDEQAKTALASRMCLSAVRELWEVSSSLLLSRYKPLDLDSDPDWDVESHFKSDVESDVESDLENCVQEVRVDPANGTALGVNSQ